jgi:protein involved in polysaccharide export with SLBB domain
MNLRLAGVLAVVLSTGALSGSLEAQSPTNSPLATREELEAILARSGKAKVSESNRKLVEARLRDGDFQNGDRIYVRVRSDSSLSDTFAVRVGQILNLPDMPPLELRGVLRSEVKERIQTHVAQYIRNPQIEVEPLLRLGLLGQVVRPGYYNVRADVPVSEVVMVAGGMGADADFKKTTAQRAKVELYDREAIRQAMAAGMSLDQLGLQTGDEIVVGKASTGFSGALPLITGVAALAAAIIGISAAL